MINKVKRIMALSACIISPLIFAGCATQPKLHIPSQQSNKLVIHPLNITTVAATNGSLTIGSNTNTPAGAASETNASPNYKVVAYSSSTNFVSAYIQIMADDDAAQEFGKDFSESFFVGEVAIENRNTTNSFLAYSSTLQVNIKYYISEKDWAAVSKNGNVPEGYIPSVRRPATYSDVLAIFDFQQKSNRRQQIYDYIQSAGAIAAGATMFIGGPVYPKAVSFATGIVTPEIQKRLLWDILLHAKNLETRSFKEIEEVPAGGSIHRVVFFPKRAIPGIVDNKMVYISSFEPRMTTYLSGSFISKVSPAATASISQ